MLLGRLYPLWQDGFLGHWLTLEHDQRMYRQLNLRLHPQ